jgi:glycerophosphoryl diester phosphodiesterase
MVQGMIRALGRLLLITLASLFGIFLLIVALRLSGLTREYADPVHPLADLDHPVIALGGDGDFAPSNSMPALRHLADHQGVMLGVDLQLSRDDVWILFRDDNLEQMTSLHGPTSLQNWTDLQNLDLGEKFGSDGRWRHTPIVTLKELLKAFPREPLFLNIHNQYSDRMSALVQQLDPDNTSNRFIIQSPYATTLRAIRKERPLWLYGIDPSSVVRFMFLNSIYVETLGDLNADLFIAPLEMNHRQVFSPRLLTELVRRKKWIVIDEPPSQGELPKDLEDAAWGIVTRHPSDFL